MKSRLLELDGCRGLLCWTVVAGHWLGSRLGWGNVNFSHSYISVDGFFILSGIVLTYVYQQKLGNGTLETLKFVMHRIERLYPLHILTFIISVFLYTKFFDSIPFKDPFLTGIYNIFLIHGLGFASSWNWNDPSWSISVEFYTSILIFPFLLKIRSTSTLISIAIVAYGLVIGRHHNLEAATDLHLLILSSGMLKCIAGMSIGVAIMKKLEKTKDKKMEAYNILILQSLSILFISYFIFTKDDIRSYDSIAILALSFTFFSLIKYSTLWNRILSSGVLVYFGKISFSIYLIHTPLMISLDQFSSFRNLNLEYQTVTFLTILVAISHFTYYFFEMLIYKKLKILTDRVIIPPVANEKADIK